MTDGARYTEDGQCKNCHEPIVFNCWYGVNGATYYWYHPPGNRTCLVKPENWTDLAWPLAEPAVDPEFLESLEQVMAEYDVTLGQLASWPGVDLR